MFVAYVTGVRAYPRLAASNNSYYLALGSHNRITHSTQAAGILDTVIAARIDGFILRTALPSKGPRRDRRSRESKFSTKLPHLGITDSFSGLHAASELLEQIVADCLAWFSRPWQIEADRLDDSRLQSTEEGVCGGARAPVVRWAVSVSMSIAAACPDCGERVGQHGSGERSRGTSKMFGAQAHVEASNVSFITGGLQQANEGSPRVRRALRPRSKC
ncbi:hypothetical protein B0J12DRAFT_8472 [Macrophomina phaseolina]|uniref:Uncharacterized protein n=1 Tax=Macrophomina phaseolina TaxID=35725 RepID=A0ABQ8GTY3_9PEZI|nr:hypothetical protein B0J12DRAFT_8472 [Macrophomina phaseolina]